MEKMADFTGILLKNLGEISSEYEEKAHWVIPEKIHTPPTDGVLF